MERLKSTRGEVPRSGDRARCLGALWHRSVRSQPTRPGSEAGDTLVELLIAIVIIAIAASAILGALTTSITSSTEHRNLSLDDTLLKSFSENVKYQIELQSKTASTPYYEDCNAASNTPAKVLTDYKKLVPGWSAPYPPAFAGYPAGYAVMITDVQFWDTQTGSFDVSGAANGTCNNSNASGIEMITVTVTDPTGEHLSLATVVRNPDYGTNYCALYNPGPANNCT